MAVTRDLPTPPLPLTTPITFFTWLYWLVLSKKLCFCWLSQLPADGQEPQFPLHPLMLQSLLFSSHKVPGTIVKPPWANVNPWGASGRKIPIGQPGNPPAYSSRASWAASWAPIRALW